MIFLSFSLYLTSYTLCMSANHLFIWLRCDKRYRIAQEAILLIPNSPTSVCFYDGPEADWHIILPGEDYRPLAVSRLFRFNDTISRHSELLLSGKLSASILSDQSNKLDGTGDVTLNEFRLIKYSSLLQLRAKTQLTSRAFELGITNFHGSNLLVLSIARGPILLPRMRIGKYKPDGP